MAETITEWMNSSSFKEIEKLSDEKLMRYYFFRDEKRASVIDYDFMMSPADGIILYQKEVICDEESIIDIKGSPYTLKDAVDNRIEFKYPVMVIGIFMSAFDVHINRMPTSGILNHYDLDTIASYNRPMLELEEGLWDKLLKKNALNYLFNNERVLNEVYVPWMNYRYWFCQIADYDVRMIVPFEDKQTRSMLQSERMGIIRWGSQVDLIVPHSDRWSFEFMQEPLMHVKAGSDPLIRIKKLSQTKKIYVLKDNTGLMRNVKENLYKGKRITVEEEVLIPKVLVEEKEGIKICEVDGNYVRQTCYMDFTQGGHYFVYPNFIPYDEVWIEKDMSMEIKEGTLIHELQERKLMAKGMFYSEAHERSSKIEKKVLQDNPVTNSDDSMTIPPEYSYLFKYGNDDIKKKIREHIKNKN